VTQKFPTSHSAVDESAAHLHGSPIIFVKSFTTHEVGLGALRQVLSVQQYFSTEHSFVAEFVAHLQSKPKILF